MSDSVTLLGIEFWISFSAWSLRCGVVAKLYIYHYESSIVSRPSIYNIDILYYYIIIWDGLEYNLGRMCPDLTEMTS